MPRIEGCCLRNRPGPFRREIGKKSKLNENEIWDPFLTIDQVNSNSKSDMDNIIDRYDTELGHRLARISLNVGTGSGRE